MHSFRLARKFHCASIGIMAKTYHSAKLRLPQKKS
jgi:hypothetical protein